MRVALLAGLPFFSYLLKHLLWQIFQFAIDDIVCLSKTRGGDICPSGVMP